MMDPSSMPLLVDDTVPFGEEDIQSTTNGKLAHPFVTFFHLFFRGFAVLAYLFSGTNFITGFVIVVLLLSMDFWTVKNITGRLMVGLRWWNYVDDDGKSHWVYEARKGLLQNKVNDKEATIFWLALVLTPVLWAILFIIALFSWSLKWLVLIFIALTLNGANLYGYIKCKAGGTGSLSNITSNFLRQQVLQNAISFVTRQPSAPPANTNISSSNTV